MGEDISPAFANASSFSVDPLEDAATNVFFGSSDEAGGASLTPTAENTATATATSAPNSPANAQSFAAPVNQSVAASSSGFAGLSTTTWLLIAAGGVAAFFFIK